MAEITCAGCEARGEPAAVEGAIMVCSNCGVTLVVDEDNSEFGNRIAGFSDVHAVGEDGMKRLKRAHGAIVRPGKKQR